jgi:hypothetical protein
MSFRERKRLADILNEQDQDDLARMFQEADVAPDAKPIPPGRYRCRLTDGELVQSKSNTKGYRLTFTVDEGEHKGRRIWLTLWFTSAAMRFAKRDLAKLGVRDLHALDAPLPHGFLCDVQVALRADDAGSERNEVSWFEVVELLDDPTADRDFASPGSRGDEEMPF